MPITVLNGFDLADILTYQKKEMLPSALFDDALQSLFEGKTSGARDR